ncbi:MAG: insulinase family protein [Rubrivivax sp.]
MKTLFAALLVACGLLLTPLTPHAAAADAAATHPDVPPREPAPQDLSQWRRLVLPNGLRVLLLSDPRLNVSSAAVAVGVGSLADPPGRQGLAHFLEHMLFLGTEKYPDVTGFDAYLRRNGGVNNAYTAEDRTNYFLEIRHEAFEGALDRFAQFFVAPRFDARFTEREANAVASEHEANLEKDSWREQQVRLQAYASNHPARHFGTGSRQTLAGVTRDELVEFWRRHYSANRMALVLTGPASADELERWARQYFGAIADRQLPPLSYPPEYLPRKPALRLLRMEPLADVRQVHLEFPLPGLHESWPHKSAELVAFVLGGEGPGSLLALLKSEGLATSLSAGASSATPQYGAFELQIGLTPQGLQQLPRVLQRVFAAVRQLREQGLPPYLFAERQALARLDERYRDRGEGGQLAAGLASLVLDHPLELAERVPFLWLQPDARALQALLARLTPDNLLATVVAKGQPVDRVEPIYGTRYSYTEDVGPSYAALLDPPPAEGLRLPPPNPFVPRSTALRELQPARLIDEPALVLHHAQDQEFQRPQAAFLLRHRLPRDLASVRTAALLRLYEACVRESLNETTYVAAEAGQRFVLSASFDGVLLATEGWDDAAGRLLDAVAPALLDVPLADERFADLKERLLRELQAFERADAYVSVRETRRALVREFYATPAELLQALRPLALADVRAFARQLYARGRLEALAYGNLPPDEAAAAVRRVAARLGTQALPDAALLRPRQLVMRPGTELRTRDVLQVNNSVMRRELVLGDDRPEARAAAQLISAVIADPFFAELRTRQQLGYIVQASAFEDERQTVALFIVQSAAYGADELDARADAFIRTLPAQLRALSPEAWAAVVAGVRARLSERDKTVAERAQRLFSLAYDHTGDWARRLATLQALDGLTQAQVADRLARALDPATRMQRSFLGFARQHAGRPGDGMGEAERAAWRRDQRYE